MPQPQLSLKYNMPHIQRGNEDVNHLFSYVRTQVIFIKWILFENAQIRASEKKNG